MGSYGDDDDPLASNRTRAGSPCFSERGPRQLAAAPSLTRLRASYVDDSVRRQTIRERGWRGATDVDGVARASCCWWIVLQRAADGPVTRCHRHQVLPLRGLLKRNDISDVLGDAQRVEVHRPAALTCVGGTRLGRLTPDPEADRGVRARGKANPAEDNLLGAGSVCSRGQTERDGDRQRNRYENWNWNCFLHDEPPLFAVRLRAMTGSDNSQHWHHAPLVGAVRRSPFSPRAASPNRIWTATHRDNPLKRSRTEKRCFWISCVRSDHN
jgi:hypothetical protein